MPRGGQRCHQTATRQQRAYMVCVSDGLAKCDQPWENPLKYSAMAGNCTRATGRTARRIHYLTELSHQLRPCPPGGRNFPFASGMPDELSPQLRDNHSRCNSTTAGHRYHKIRRAPIVLRVMVRPIGQRLRVTNSED